MFGTTAKVVVGNFLLMSPSRLLVAERSTWGVARGKVRRQEYYRSLALG